FILSRLIEGHFPNYEQVIPKSEKTTSTVDREQLLLAVKRASLLTSPEAQSVKIDLLKNKLLVSSRSPNMGEAHEELEAELSGEDQTIGFNPDYLMDVLKNLDVEKVQLSVLGPDKPGLVKGKKDALHVIMPMQLN
ncbi:MAG: DNA polymerase III subunit beta, partial [Candidatus Omnitrophica bacterium]|nr:DNA polymerase III subunit beta [Candidatus Omnitrophota bacterium]